MTVLFIIKYLFEEENLAIEILIENGNLVQVLLKDKGRNLVSIIDANPFADPPLGECNTDKKAEEFARMHASYLNSEKLSPRNQSPYYRTVHESEQKKRLAEFYSKTGRRKTPFYLREKKKEKKKRQREEQRKRDREIGRAHV